jgi:hypothetical protein
MEQRLDISIDITREEHKLTSVRVIMPTWNRRGEDGKLYAKVPFLGLETYGENENDLDEAIEEAFMCFCLASEKHGLGLESELEFIGWTKTDGGDEDHSMLQAITDNEAVESALSTGDTRALAVDLSTIALETA